MDYKKLTSAAWFDYEVEKLCSISASMATMAFNKFFANIVGDYCTYNYERGLYEQYEHILSLAADKGAMFDCRCFNIPKEEVTNYIYWRQLDASRNSIQMVGQANFSHSELQNKTCNQIQDMLMTQKKLNWNDLPTHLKRGSCCIKKTCNNKSTLESHWIIDKDIPIFKSEDRKYIDDLVFVGEE